MKTPLAIHDFFSADGEALLQLALRHPRCGPPHNQRLEFLGDAALNFLSSELLYRHYPDAGEGRLTILRAQLVSNDNLARLAEQLQLQELIEYDPAGGSGVRPGKKALADTLEAVFGALFLHGGLEACRTLLSQLLEPQLEALKDRSVEDLQDAKSRLNILLMARQLPPAEYELLASTETETRMCCRVPGTEHASEARGLNRREAEQEAAERLLARLREEPA